MIRNTHNISIRTQMFGFSKLAYYYYYYYLLDSLYPLKIIRPTSLSTVKYRDAE